MKLGTETGSLVNHMYARGTRGQPAPEVGMGATLLLWTDRQAATIIAVETDAQGRTMVTVQEDAAKVIRGSERDGSAEYAYTADPRGATYTFRMEEGKGWRAVTKGARGRWKLAEGHGLRIGDRRHYRDPSF